MAHAWTRGGVAAFGLVLGAGIAAAQQPVPLDGPEAEAIRQAVDRTRLALAQESPEALAACVDVPRMTAQALAMIGEKPLAGKAATSAEGAVAFGIRRLRTEVPWDRFRVKRIDTLAPDDRCVILRVWRGAALGERMRWWMARAGGTWRLYDVEHMEAGMRHAHVAGATLRMQLGGDTAWVRHAPTLEQVRLALAGSDAGRAQALLDHLGPAPLPGPYDTLRATLRGAVQAEMNAWDELLASVTAIEARQADVPILGYWRALALEQQKQPVPAGQHARTWLERYGEDPAALWVLGRALAAQAQKPAAADVFRRGLRDDPDSAGHLIELAAVLPVVGKAELATWLDAMHDPVATLDAAGWSLRQAEDAEGLAVLAAALRKKRPDAPEADYWEGEAHVARKAWAAACVSLAKAWPRTSTAQQPVWFGEYCWVAVHAGKAAEAYAAATDKRAAMQILGDTCVELKDGKALAAVVAAHRGADPADPTLPLWDASARGLAGDHAGAVDALRPHLAVLLADEAHVAQAEDTWIRALIACKRFDDALAAARDSTARDGDPYFEAVVHAARGNVEATRAVLLTLAAQGYPAERFYRDAILGPVMRSEAFADLRVLFPEPPPDARR